MSRFRLWGAILLAPVLVALLSTVGCGGGSTDKPKDQPKSADKAGTDTGAKPVPSSEKTALEATDTATLKGKVTYDGDPPARKDFQPQMEVHKDKDVCLKGDHLDQIWMVNPADKGVANVVVWLRAPAGKFFKIPADQQKREDVTMDQPNCAFIPHVVAFNPSVWDPETKQQKKTGQVFKVLNSAPMPHNTAGGGDPLLNPSINLSLPSKGAIPVDAKPCKPSAVGGEDLLNFQCNIHAWMTAKVAVFDHPYYAVTDLNGNYEIKNAPAGAEVIFTYWHESMETLKKAVTDKMTLKPGDNTKDIKIK